MSEIEKLKLRLANVGKNVTEYRMTVVEAKQLAAEIVALEQALAAKPTVEYVREEQATDLIVRVLDGGSF